MGKTIDLTAADGHKFSAYVAEPSGKPKGALGARDARCEDAFEHLRADAA